MILYLDTETYSPLPLRGSSGVGAYRYHEHPESAVILLAYALDDGPVHVLEEPGTVPGESDTWAEVLGWLTREDVLKVAHNATFDRAALSQYVYGRATGQYLPPEQWEDTAALAAAAGLPRSLAGAAEVYGLDAKDTAGPALIRRFTTPWPATRTRPAGRVPASAEPERWAAFRRYAAQDVEVLRQLRHALLRDPLAPTSGSGSPLEGSVQVVSDRINDRGIPVDREALLLLSDGDAAARADAGTRLSALTGLDRPGSRDAMLDWLRLRGLDLPDLARGTLEAALPQTSGDVREAVELRLEMARTSGQKIATARRMSATDGRVRGTLRYLGAHTGRWAGAGFQPQNLSREPLRRPFNDVLDDLRVGAPVGRSEIGACVRSVIGARGRPLLVADFTSIEAVTLAWLAGESWLLAAYDKGEDLYVATAQRLEAATGRAYARQAGTVASLALGYGGSVGALRAMGGSGSDDALRSLVDAWRAANPKIVALWERLGREMRYGGETITRVDQDVTGRPARVMTLPSGRRLVYRGVRAVSDRWGRPSVAYWDPVRRTAVETYGGRLTENLTQAVARDVLAHSLVRLDRHGFDVVAHVHDEVIAEGSPENWDAGAGRPSGSGVTRFQEMRKIMEEMPSWAKGLRIRAEGGIVDRYRKLGDADEIARR